MKVSPEMGSVINIIRKEGGDRAQNKAEDAKARKAIEDVVSIENKQASGTDVKSVDDARRLLSSVLDGMKDVTSDLYAVDVHRVSSMVG